MVRYTLEMLWCWWTWEVKTGSAVPWVLTQTSTVWQRSLRLAFRPRVGSVQEEVFSPAHALLSSSLGKHTAPEVSTHIVALPDVKPQTLLVWPQRRWQSWRLDSAFWPKLCPENNKWICQRSKWTHTDTHTLYTKTDPLLKRHAVLLTHEYPLVCH